VFRDALRLVGTTWTESGIAGFYRGSLVYIVGSTPAHCAYYVGYKVSKDTLTPMLQPAGVPLPIIHAIAGVAADVLATPLWVPCDIVMQRLQLQADPAMEKYVNARGTFPRG
jgi:hypothetical protein